MVAESPARHEVKASDAFTETKQIIHAALATEGIVILPPMDVEVSLKLLTKSSFTPKVTMIDPWYNKGIGGIREDYKEYIIKLLSLSGHISEHVFFWGFPEIVARFIDDIPPL